MAAITETNEQYYEGNNIGGYQFIPLDTIITNFTLMFTGEGKVIPKARRTEIQMHAHRAVQEFSYDVFKSYKSQEIEVPPSLTVRLPQDYVNYTQFSWIDADGLERPIYPLRQSSNPASILQDSDYEYIYDGAGGLTYATNSEAWTRLKANSETGSTEDPNIEGFEPNSSRFGLDPETANANGGFYIDPLTGLVHFTSTLYGKILHLKYISDGLAVDADTVVHKFAEDAVYKYILYSIIAVTEGAQEYLVRRYRKSFTSARRVAKLRLSNFKATELTQLVRGKSKQIKH